MSTLREHQQRAGRGNATKKKSPEHAAKLREILLKASRAAQAARARRKAEAAEE